jgi:hypothetical protein
MAKVSVTLGLTLKMNSGGGFNFFRPEINISDIETEADIAPQIERSLAAIKDVWAAIEENMGTIVDSSELAEKPSALTEINRRIAEFEADVSQLKSRLDGATAGEGATASVSIKDGDTEW